MSDLDPSDVLRLRQQLGASGFIPLELYNIDEERTLKGEPIPLTSRGKVPVAAKWQDVKAPPKKVNPKALNTGILSAGLQPIDIDVDDPAIAQAIRDAAFQRFGETPMRVRGTGARCLLLCRALDGTQPAKRVAKGAKGKVEVLGRGQQFQAFGLHYTGAALEWMPDAPGFIRREDLPLARFEEVSKFLAEIQPLLGEEDAQPERKPNGHHPSSRHGLTAGIFEIMRALDAIPNTGAPDWEAWNRVGMALWSACSGGEAGRELWHSWSRKHPAYDESETDARWLHYPTSPPRDIGAGTLFHLARQVEPVPEESAYGSPHGSQPVQQTRAEPQNEPPTAVWFSDDVPEEKDIPPRPWLAKGYLLRGSVTLIAGSGSAGKSSLFKAWAVASALGVPFSRFVPNAEFRVISYNVEDDKNEEHRRLSATLRYFGRRASELKGRYRTVGPKDIGTLIERDTITGKIRLTEAMIGLEWHINTFKPDVVFLDPLVELHTSEENDNTGLRAVIAQLRALAIRHGIVIVLAHHARKGTVTPGDPDAVRGAGAIVGAARVVFTVCGMTEEEAAALNVSPQSRKFYFRVDGAKMNYTPADDAEWFERRPYCLDNEEDVAAAVPWQAPQETITTNHIETIKSGLANGIDGEPYTFRAGTPRSITTLYVKHEIRTEKAQRQITDELKGAGFVEIAYRRPTRNFAKGIRTPEGEPANVAWQ